MRLNGAEKQTRLQHTVFHEADWQTARDVERCRRQVRKKYRSDLYVSGEDGILPYRELFRQRMPSIIHDAEQ